MKSKNNIRWHQTGFTTVFVLATFILTASSAFVGFAQQASQPTAAAADSDQFAGTWSAVHAGTSYFILELHKENGTLAGGIRVCTFTTSGEGEQADMTITNKTLSESLPIRNLIVSVKSLSFDWKDPDGDQNHLKFERTTEHSGRMSWHDLPADAKMPVISLTRENTKSS